MKSEGGNIMHETASSPSLAARINHFFFDEETPFGLALLRISLPIVVLFTLVPRWVRAREIYSLDGSPTPIFNAYPGWENVLPVFSATVATALFSAMIFLFVTLSIGWMTRVSAIGSCALFTYFTLVDSVSTLTKHTVITSHVLLLLCLARSGDVWSVDAWLKRRSPVPTSGVAHARARSAAWPRRLLQLLIGVIYLGAAATKMHTPSYFSGDQLLFWMRTDLNSNNPLGDVLAFYPALLQVMAYVTIGWEILFLFISWRGLSRTIMLSIGVFFHLMTIFTLGLIIFPSIYFCLYLTFLNEDDVAWYRAKWSRWMARLGRERASIPLPATETRPVAAPAWWNAAGAAPVFCLTLAACIFLGVEAEYRMDLYGERRPEGRYVLAPASDARISQLFGPEVEIAPLDQLFSFEVGTVTVGGTLADRRRTFEHGEEAIVQCCFNPPHEDMWVEVDLHDGADRIITRNGQILPREMLRSSLVYPLPEALESGEYTFVLKVEGEEIARRRFLLSPDNE
jgi:hypothetical protein